MVVGAGPSAGRRGSRRRGRTAVGWGGVEEGKGAGIYDGGGPGTYSGAQRRSRTAGGRQGLGGEGAASAVAEAEAEAEAEAAAAGAAGRPQGAGRRRRRAASESFRYPKAPGKKDKAWRRHSRFRCV